MTTTLERPSALYRSTEMASLLILGIIRNARMLELAATEDEVDSRPKNASGPPGEDGEAIRAHARRVYIATAALGLISLGRELVRRLPTHGADQVQVPHLHGSLR